MIEHKDLLFKQNVTWDGVWNIWKAYEGSDPVWQRFAVKEKGFESWDAWRRYQISFLKPETLQWCLYKIKKPMEFIPSMRLGPFRGWQKHFVEKNVKTFADLVDEQYDWVKENVGVKNRLENFPQKTQFIALYLKDEDVYVMYEGHHRATAISLAVNDGVDIDFTSLPTLAVAEIEYGGKRLMNRLLEIPRKKLV